MTLQDLVDELRANILRDASSLLSGTANDKMWTDTSLVRYIDDAYFRWAKRTFCIRDGTTTAATQITLVAAQEYYTCHSSTLGVLSARYNTDTADLARIGHTILSRTPIPDESTYFPNAITQLSPGRPLAWSTDEYLTIDSEMTPKLRIFPAPTADEAGNKLYLRIIRKPLAHFTTTSMSTQTPEIPTDYHLDLLDWAAYRALRNIDADAGNLTAAEKFKARFEEAVKECQTEIRRKLFADIKWGFGRAGFRYER
jgi:hypothetical protein